TASRRPASGVSLLLLTDVCDGRLAGKPWLARRRPLSRTRVFFCDRPRRPMPAEPEAQPLLEVSLVALPVLAEMERSRSATVALPETSSCSREMTWSGFGPSASTRRRLEPVTTTGARVLLSPAAL